jgi:DNA-binding NarL/FixJ family response regulator
MRDPFNMIGLEKLTPEERKERDRLQEKTSRMWRDYWIRVAKNHGYTNAEIANEFEISESTVRTVSKK